MAIQLEKELRTEIDYRQSWTIGDKLTDVEFGRGLGTKTAIIRSTNWTDSMLSGEVNLIVNSLYEAAATICR